MEGVVLRDLGDKFGLVFEDLGPVFHSFDVVLDALAHAELDWDLHDSVSQQENSLSHVRGVTDLEVLNGLGNVLPNRDPVMLTALDVIELVVADEFVQEASHKGKNVLDRKTVIQ